MVPSFISLKTTLTVVSGLALTTCVAAAPSSIVARQVRSGNGAFSAPTSGLVVTQGSSFPFAFQDSNWCEDGYSPIAVWLTNYAPTTSNLNSTGQFPEGQYSYYFGQYLVPNFGLPAMTGSAPPSTLVLPELPDLTTGEEVYLAVVETGTNCPPVGVHSDILWFV
ncbi:hypothetical protein GYMLUDRAFT_171421 [Collybiopsis luxurians FD-317 M1]|uniref:Uncharacterized protein n=1 Tax=Collybiopsis luxurians FD-317 M1 TaxID=944289 RepID=A0A0D0CIN5_9AGAR|nr:hypothetical protein GYMLUDRAFT_171421 [Collybiopsis luxurians FD-317 M1]